MKSNTHMMGQYGLSFLLLAMAVPANHLFAANMSQRMHQYDGFLVSSDKQGVYRSRLQRFKEKRSAQTMTLTASPKWENWEPVKKVVPPTLGDAPIFLVKGLGDYWLFGRNNWLSGYKKRRPR